ncbi:MAG: hypothetical protein ACYDAL_09035 [Candidatus Dormibacteraceae bacterium]
MDLQTLIVRLIQLLDLLSPILHPQEVVVALLNDSIGLLLKVWFGFILSTTDFETGRDFITDVTIQRFEPKVQWVADAALVLITMWACYRIMWGHGLRSQYTARILLPRLFMGVVLINFSLPLFQVLVALSNAMCAAIASFGTIGDPSSWWSTLAKDPTQGAWEIVTTAVLAIGFDVFAIAYLVRYAILIVLAITAPLAGLFFMLPETHHLSKMWASHFTSNLFMQPAQLFVLTIGFALERGGGTTVHHLFALASLLIVFKVPGALGGAEKAAHKLQSSVDSAFHHIEHALVKV